MKKLILMLIIILFFSNSYALSYSEAKKYIDSNVVVAYTEADKVCVAEGIAILLVEVRDDYTMDKIYSYMVLRTKTGLKTIKISTIEKIEVILGL